MQATPHTLNGSGRFVAARDDPVEKLLLAVVAGTQSLAACADLYQGLNDAMVRLGPLSGHDRAYVWQFSSSHTTLVAEWVAPDVGSVATLMGERSFALEGFHEVLLLLARGEVYQSIVREKTGLNAELNTTIRTLSDVMAPVFAGGRLWGCVGLDNCREERTYSDCEQEALRGVAGSIGAAVDRLAAWEAQRASERERIERAETDSRELRQREGLLHVVTEAARELLAGPHFDQTVLLAMARLGRGLNVGRVTLVENLPATDAQPGGRWRLIHEWAADGAATQCGAGVEEGDNPDGDAIDRLRAGQTVILETPASDDASSRGQHAAAVHSNLAVPVFVEQRWWGVLTFDDCVGGRTWAPHERAVLETAGTCLGAAIERRQLEDRRIEGERRLERERESAALHKLAELARVNESLRVSLDALAESANEQGFVARSVTEIGAQAGALRTDLFRLSGEDGLYRLAGTSCLERFLTEPGADDPAAFRLGFALDSEVRARLQSRKRLSWFVFDDGSEQAVASDLAGVADPVLAAWRQQGYRAAALHALMVGNRCVGLLSMAFGSATAVPDHQQELVHALSHPLALALELLQLAKRAQRSAEREAVMTERTRLAREIHDGIAQSFLAIQMQLGASGSPDAPVAQALDLARHGLHEARRAVAALRPHPLLDRSLPEALKRALGALTTGTRLNPQFEEPTSWQRLPSDVEDHLFRMIQEAVNNAVKHSRAGVLKVELSQVAGETTALVADDGIGFAWDRVEPGFGLDGMRQRAALIGARLQWLTAPRQGTQVLISVPSVPFAASERTDARQ